MAIGNALSFRTDGRFILQASTGLSSSIPGPKTQLIFKEIILSVDSSGLPTLSTPVTIQSLNGILRPLKPIEKEQWGKIAITASYAYYVSPSQFTSEINKSKLVEKNVLTSATKTYEIVGIEDNTNTERGAHYKILLEVLL